MKTQSIAVYFVAFAAFFMAMIEEKAEANSATVSGTMPAYTGTDGCGPLAVAMDLGYWDTKYGDANLFTVKGGIPQIGATPGTGLYLTSNVETELRSIALYCQTDGTGGTLTSNLTTGIVNYTASKGYTFQVSATRPGLTLFWSNLVADINANNPPIFYVDNDGDGVADHFVPVIGYDDNYQNSGQKYYEYYSTGSEAENPLWIKFQALGSGNVGGVYNDIRITSSVPEPSTLFMVIGGMGILAFVQRSRRHSF
jgi:hypothetical protein